MNGLAARPWLLVALSSSSIAVFLLVLRTALDHGINGALECHPVRLVSVGWSLLLLFMPAFLRHPEEAAIIGRLLAGYGELEFLMAMCLGSAMGDKRTALRALFRMKSERVKVADSLLFPLCERASMAGPYSAAIGGMRHCANIRNQYAHSNWADDINHGLFFVDLQKSTQTINIKDTWNHTDKTLLIQQEAFFCNTMGWWDYIRDQFDVKQGRRYAPLFQEPPRLPQPPLHNPPDTHIPPWIDSETSTHPEAKPPEEAT